ncbi:hypothetical protein MIND_00703300 [Mycena indigotica]|uniref:Uncharacterized protein n=1 Tax=Mycena indigotica TaxID=2126181 RepID=A0A8H6W3B3_9AGAR|nr:uncharacterized protein MIND_00703300 [Mycena indigotica]KAF7301381.1 hypothetical protein MIND_00703300 [Mycena indigotica]
MYSPTSLSPASSPTRTGPLRTPHKTAIPHGFRPAPKPKRPPISEMSVRELEDLQASNARLLSSRAASSSKDPWVKRVNVEQTAVTLRLNEIRDMNTINTGLRNTVIIGEDDMSVEPPPEPYTNPMLEAKRKALSRFAPANEGNGIGSLNMQEAIELEQAAHRADKERQERMLEKRQRRGMPLPGEELTRQEREARIWAFMNHKPTESDLEDDSEDEYDDDPANWFSDEEDDGRKGQLIVEPDEEDMLSSVIRVDESKIPSHYSVFYEPRDN